MNTNTTPTIIKAMSLNLFSKNNENVPVAGNTTADMRVSVRGPKVNALLLGEGIEIAGLQEVTPAWQGWLADGLDKSYHYLGTCTHDTKEGGYIVYRADIFTALESGTFWMAPGAPASPAWGWDTRYDRLCTWGLFQHKLTGSYFLFLDAHLDHIGEEAKTNGAHIILEQIKLLQDKVSESYGVTNCPIVLTGDMNSTPVSDPYRIFTAQLNDSLLCAQKTDVALCDSSSPGLYYQENEDAILRNYHRIDYVLVNEDCVKVQEYKMIHTATNLCKYGPYVTDHNAVIAILSIHNETAK